MLLISCSKEEQRVGQTEFVLNVEVDQTSSQTKGVITDTEFGPNETIGLFVYYGEEKKIPHENLALYGENYRNVKATRATSVDSPGKWKFNFNGTLGDFYNFYLMSPSTELFGKGLTVYAYSPWISGAQSIDDIYFTLGGNKYDLVDLMYAKQNMTEENACLDHEKKPDGSDKVPVNLTFKHALSLIEFKLKCAHPTSTMTLYSVTLSQKGETPLYNSGSFNALTNKFTLTDDNKGDITSYYHYNGMTDEFTKDGRSYFTTIIPTQEDYINESYEVSFNMNGHDLVYKYKIKADDLAYGKFEPGKKYVFNFTFDNYIQLQNVSVSDDWSNDEINIKF